MRRLTLRRLRVGNIPSKNPVIFDDIVLSNGVDYNIVTGAIIFPAAGSYKISWKIDTTTNANLRRMFRLVSNYSNSENYINYIYNNGEAGAAIVNVPDTNFSLSLINDLTFSLTYTKLQSIKAILTVDDFEDEIIPPVPIPTIKAYGGKFNSTSTSVTLSTNTPTNITLSGNNNPSVNLNLGTANKVIINEAGDYYIYGMIAGNSSANGTITLTTRVNNINMGISNAKTFNKDENDFVAISNILSLAAGDSVSLSISSGSSITLTQNNAILLLNKLN